MLNKQYKQYIVTWSVYEEACSPLDAAREALKDMRDCENNALCFTVKDPDTGEETKLDLDSDE